MKRLAIAALLCMFAGPSVAQDEEGQWRIGGSLSYSEYDPDDGSIGKDGGVGFKGHAQYKWNSFLGVEGAYYVSPDFYGDQTPNAGGGETETSYQGITIHALGYLPTFVERMDFFLKAGYFNFFDVTLKVDGVTAETGSDDGMALGFGASIDAGDNIGIRLEFDWYDTTGTELWTIGLGGEYRF